MPKHVREKFLRSFQNALDCTWEFQQLERLNDDEKKFVASIRDGIADLQQKASELIPVLEERGDFQLPPAAKGQSFSWAAHDERAKRKTLEDKIKRLKLELAEVLSAR